MGDVDAGNVKAKASIEYDPSGLKQMKEDLASLEQAAGSAGESAGQASEKMAGLGESMSGSAGGAKEFSAALDELPKIAESGTSAVSEMSGVLEEHRAAVEEAGSAYESLQKPVETVTSSLEKAAPAMQVASEHTRGLNENLSQAQQSFSDLSAAIAEPGATEAYTNLWKSVSGESLGASPLANFEVFQKAYNAIDSSGMYDAAGGMQMIDEHLDKTGQSYEQFAGSLSGKNQQLLHEMSMDWSQINTTIDGAGQSFQKAGEKAQTGFSTIASSAGDADQAVAEFLGKTTKAVNEVGGSSGMKSIGMGEAFGNATEGMMGMLNNIAMPLMAVQMIAMAVQQAGQAIYDSAAIAEGPAAHSFGTFTGTVDALGQSIQRTGGQFSESFGQSITPTLNALNSQMAGGGDIGSNIGHWIGTNLSTLANLWQIGSGFNPVGGAEGLANQAAQLFGMPQPFQGPAPVDQAQVTYQQSVANMPQTVRNLSYQSRTQSDQLLEMASNPDYLQSQDEAQAAQTVYQRAQQRYNSTHYISPQQLLMNYQEQRYDAQQIQNYQQQMAETGGYGPVDFGGYWGGVFANNNSGSTTSANRYGTRGPGVPASGGGIDWGSIGGFFGGIGKSISDFWNQPNGGADTLGMLFSPQAWGFGQSSPQTFTGGCFVAGTPVLLADGSSKPIEMLRVDERVLAYDGEKQIPATIIGCIMFPAKQTYELAFSDGKTLITTDSHPLAGESGWKSISPASTAQENPGLPVTMLAVGDSLYTADGTLCRLMSIQKRKIAPVYNITVDTVHTYYAGGILVHNAKANTIGQQASEQIGDIQLPHMDLSGLSSQLGSNFSSIQLPHMDLSGISGSLAGVFSGISMPPIPDIGSQISGALGGMFSGISMPAIPDIGGQISGALGGMFSGISMPSIPDIGGMLSGALSGMFGGISIPSIPDVGAMVSGAMSGMFGGITPPTPPDVGAMINGAMSGMFGGIVVPSPPDVGAMINGAMSGMFGGISVPSVPFFASGVSNFGGGPAIVGEGNTPEVVEANGRYSLFDQGATFVNLPAGASVYPMQEMGGYSSPRMLANGTGSGSFTPLSIGGGGMPESITVHVHIGPETIISSIGIPLAQDVRLASGNRSY